MTDNFEISVLDGVQEQRNLAVEELHGLRMKLASLVGTHTVAGSIPVDEIRALVPGLEGHIVTDLKQAVAELAAKWQRESVNESPWDGNTQAMMVEHAADLRALVGALRTWEKGDPEPSEIGLNLIDKDGGDAWFLSTDGAWSGPYGYSLTWTALLDMRGPLTEARSTS